MSKRVMNILVGVVQWMLSISILLSVLSLSLSRVYISRPTRGFSTHTHVHIQYSPRSLFCPVYSKPLYSVLFLCINPSPSLSIWLNNNCSGTNRTVHFRPESFFSLPLFFYPSFFAPLLILVFSLLSSASNSSV